MDILSCLVPHVEKHVEFILNKRSIGLGDENLDVKNPQTSTDSLEKVGNCDRFTVVIPYACVSVEFVVIFQASDPKSPPDFIFISDPTFFVPLDEMESLREWDVAKTDGLYNVIKEIMTFYKKKNIKDLEKYINLNYDYLSLFQMSNFNEDDIEIYVPFKSNSPIIFLIRLHVEFCDIFPDVTPAGSALLSLEFSAQDNYEKYSQSLYLLNEIKSALVLNSDFEFPRLSGRYQLSQFIVAIEDKLRSEVDFLASGYASKKSYFEKFLSYYDIMEYDSVSFNYMVLLLEVEEYSFLLEIHMPANFPLGIPQLIFRSIHKESIGIASSIIVDSYPYCSTWSLDEVFSETFKIIEANASMLKEDDQNLCSEMKEKEAEKNSNAGAVRKVKLSDSVKDVKTKAIDSAENQSRYSASDNQKMSKETARESFYTKKSISKSKTVELEKTVPTKRTARKTMKAVIVPKKSTSSKPPFETIDGEDK